MRRLTLYSMALSICAIFFACNDSHETFDNKLFYQTPVVSNVIVKPTVNEITKVVRMSLAKLAETDIDITVGANTDLVSVYNKAYYDTAELLPQEFYEIPEPNTVIKKGGLNSGDVVVYFKNLKQLETEDKTYVLPISIVSASNIDIHRSGNVSYFVVKGGSIINVVADMEKDNYITFPTFDNSAQSGNVCNDMNDFTIEALVRSRQFVPGIQTILGIENYFLLRVSDNGLEPNQLQLVNPYGASSTNAETCLLNAGEWTHIAIVGNSQTHTISLYINDRLALNEAVDASYWKPLSLGKPYKHFNGQLYNFYIGFSYEAGREWDGEISEVRIWNVARTEEQVTSLDYIYEVDPKSEGLVAYWKFDEGEGETIHDYTENGNDGKAKSSVKWTYVSLPELK
ncbi:DUF1735 domain-containing protein [Bacteroides caecigallinarum]|uniref:DUF1735 and LamG domain-containing protein n=1 Tax=Bacteroides caecigallinarum TaxID=1411144 RepID=UPI00195B3960|nr:DUF1735 and LamG domain-containing protein [Bacteroides caecigallinarum]MBM6866754.1 DUF1735 domain-containing protein [Bacteroides caecigallinarum]